MIILPRQLLVFIGMGMGVGALCGAVAQFYWPLNCSWLACLVR